MNNYLAQPPTSNTLEVQYPNKSLSHITSRMEDASHEIQTIHAGQCLVVTGDNLVCYSHTHMAQINGDAVVIIGESKALVPATQNPTRLLILCGGNTPKELTELASSEIFRHISLVLSARPLTSDVILLGAHRNKKGNIILSFPYETPNHTLTSLIPVVRMALGLPDTVKVTLDIPGPWSKIMVSFVRARHALGSPIFTEAEVATSFLRNPAIAKLSITSQPRWVRNPESITGVHSSFVFAFKDRDGSIAHNILGTRLFAFGAPVKTTLWIENTNIKPKPVPSRPRKLISLAGTDVQGVASE